MLLLDGLNHLMVSSAGIDRKLLGVQLKSVFIRLEKKIGWDIFITLGVYWSFPLAIHFLSAAEFEQLSTNLLTT